MGQSSSKQIVKGVLITGAVVVGAAVVSTVVATVVIASSSHSGKQNNDSQTKSGKNLDDVQQQQQQDQSQQQQSQQPQPQQPQQQQPQSSISDLAFINKVAKELQEFEKQQKPLSLDTILKLFEQGFMNAREQYGKLQKQNRIERRNLKNDPQKYVQSVLNFNEQLEQLLTDGQQQLCDKLKIDSQTFEQSFMYYLEDQQSAQQIMQYQVKLRSQLSSSIQYTKNISELEFEKVLLVQMEILKNHNYFQNYLKYIPRDSMDLISVVVSVILSDYVYEQTQIEEEDLIHSFERNPIQMMQFAQIQQGVMEMMQNLQL